MNKGSIRPILFFSFFLSGFSSLVYEIAWTRELTLILGGTTSALAAILSAFMLGLALGSLLIGRRIDRWAAPLNRHGQPKLAAPKQENRFLESPDIFTLKVFGLLELAIGLGGVLLTFLLSSLESTVSLLYGYFPPGSQAIVAIRFAGAFILLLLPTLAMGGTFPAIVRFLVGASEDTGRIAGRLYAINVAGAVLGVLFSGIYALEALGTLRTVYLAAGINLSVGILALLLPSGAEASSGIIHPNPDTHLSGTHHTNGPRWLILVLFALSGLTGLGYQQAYHRLMVFVVGNSIYGLTILLAVFLAGMALGSWEAGELGRWGKTSSTPPPLRPSAPPLSRSLTVAAPISSPAPPPLLTLGLVELGLAAAAPFSILSFQTLPDLFPLGTSFWSDFGWRFILALLAIAPVAILLGASFPLALRGFVGEREDIGGSTAKVYASNTLGAICGPLLVAFFLIPWLGIKGSLLALAVLNLGIGALLVVRHPGWRVRSRTLAITFPLLIAGLVVFLTGGTRLKMARVMAAGESLFYHEGKDSTVEVYQDRKNPYYRWLSINGAVEVTIDYSSLQTFKVMGHLPLLLHREPKNVLVVSLGAGIVLGAVTRHPVQSIDCVEISSGAVKAQPFFQKENYGAIQDKRVNLVIDDARSYLLGTNKKYDVILMDATHPGSADSWVLYTREYYELCRKKLAEGGLILQWVPLHQISSVDYASILRTFLSVFPHSSIWSTYRHTILMGSPSPFPLDLVRMIERMQFPAVNASLAEVGLNHPLVLSNGLLLGEQALAKFSKGNTAAGINTDDHSPVQFSESRQYPRDTRAANLRKILEYRESPLPYVVIPLELQDEEKEALKETFLRFEKVKANNLQGVLQMEEGEYASAVDTFNDSLQAIPGEADSRNLLNLAEAAYTSQIAQLQARAGSIQRNLSPEERSQAVADLLKVGSSQLEQGRQNQALESFKAALELDSSTPQVHHYLGLAYLEEKQFQKATVEWRRAVELDPDYAEAHNFLAVAYYFAKEYPLAIRHSDRARELGYPVQPGFLEALRSYR